MPLSQAEINALANATRQYGGSLERMSRAEYDAMLQAADAALAERLAAQDRAARRAAAARVNRAAPAQPAAVPIARENRAAPSQPAAVPIARENRAAPAQPAAVPIARENRAAPSQPAAVPIARENRAAPSQPAAVPIARENRAAQGEVMPDIRLDAPVGLNFTYRPPATMRPAESYRVGNVMSAEPLPQPFTSATHMVMPDGSVEPVIAAAATYPHIIDASPRNYAAPYMQAARESLGAWLEPTSQPNVESLLQAVNIPAPVQRRVANPAASSLPSSAPAAAATDTPAAAATDTPAAAATAAPVPTVAPQYTQGDVFDAAILQSPNNALVRDVGQFDYDEYGSIVPGDGYDAALGSTATYADPYTAAPVAAQPVGMPLTAAEFDEMWRRYARGTNASAPQAGSPGPAATVPIVAPQYAQSDVFDAAILQSPNNALVRDVGQFDYDEYADPYTAAPAAAPPVLVRDVGQFDYDEYDDPYTAALAAAPPAWLRRPMTAAEFDKMRRLSSRGTDAYNYSYPAEVYGMRAPYSQEVRGPISGGVRGPISGEVRGPISGEARGPISGGVRGPYSQDVRGPYSQEVRGPYLTQQTLRQAMQEMQRMANMPSIILMER